MPHIMYSADVSTKAFNESDDGYYPVARQVGERANMRARRTDITSVIGASAGAGAPACFYPHIAELHINTEACDLGQPEKVDFSDRLWLHEHAPAVGAVTHEAAHARHTRWSQTDLDEAGATPRIMDVIVTLEEPRIEACAMREYPDDKTFLRGVALEIVGKDFVISDTPYGAAAAAGLLLARVDAKTVTRREVAGFRRDITAVLGADVLGDLETLWQRFLRLYDTDYAGMVHIADAWLTIIGMDSEPEDDEDAEPMAGGSMMGEPQPGDGEGEGEGEGEPKDGSGFGKKIKGKVRIAESKVDKEHVGAAGDEKVERRRKEREADAERRRASDSAHETAGFGVHGWSPEGFTHYVGERAPSDDERRAAKRLASALEKVDYRDRAVTKVHSMVPPGRLRGRAAVQAEAYAEVGRDTEVAVWSGKRRTRVDSTPLTIGFMGDVSGSMNAAMEPLGSSQWVVSTAGAHIDAKVATVHFGDKVEAVAPVGFREKGVRLFYPGGGSEAFRAGALALDKELNLLDGRGARLLFVASDAVYVNGTDMEYSRTFNRLAAGKGVAVIYLNFTGSVGGGAQGAAQGIDCTDASPAEVAALCGRAAIAELKRIDRKV